MSAWWQKLGLLLLDFLLPRQCVFCRGGLQDETDMAVCEACQSQMEWVTGPLCPRCGRVFGSREGADHLCGACQTEPPPFAQARAAVLYDEDGPVGLAIKRFKYGRRMDLLPVMQGWLKTPACRELVEVAD